MIRRVLTSLTLTAAIAAIGCGGAAAPSPTSTVAATAGERGPYRFTVADTSKATIRVREQLAIVPAPSDAVLEVTGVKGEFTLNEDGSFAASSNITVDMNTIRSDQANRDRTIKRSPLEVDRFPTASFVPTRATGLTLPLPSSGELSFRLTGKMTIHGTEKEVTFDVNARRDGKSLSATATAAPTWKFGDFGMEIPRAQSVLSVVDEIKLEFSLVATQA